jgi:hypothetical protein
LGIHKSIPDLEIFFRLAPPDDTFGITVDTTYPDRFSQQAVRAASAHMAEANNG